MAALFSIFRVSLFWFIRCLCLNICLFWIWCCCKCCHFLFGYWILIHLWFITSSIRMHEVLSIHVFWWPCWFSMKFTRSEKLGSIPDSMIMSARSTHLDRRCSGSLLTIFSRLSQLFRSASYPICSSVSRHLSICMESRDSALRSFGFNTGHSMSFWIWARAILCGRPYLFSSIFRALWCPSVGSWITQSSMDSFASPVQYWIR